MSERREGAVASLPLERGRALGWGRSPFLGQEGVGDDVKMVGDDVKINR